MTLSRLLIAALVGWLCSGPALAQSRRIYLGQASDDVRERVQSLDDALADEDRDPVRTAALVAELLAAGGDLSTCNHLVRTDDAHHRGLRARLVDSLPDLPKAVLDALRASQQRAAKQALRGDEPPDPTALLRRFPASELAAEAAAYLWQQAFEQDDRGQCAALREFLDRLHPGRLAAPNPPLPQKPQVPQDLPGARLLLSKELPLAERGEPTFQTHSPSYPLVVGGRVCVSDGAQIKVYDLAGELLGRIPAHRTAAAKAPGVRTRFQARMSHWGGVVFAPMVLEGWLAPARARAPEDGSLANRFYTLLAFDPERARILWWDSDSGRSTPAPRDPDAEEGAPDDPKVLVPPAPGLGQLLPPLENDLSMGHVIAVAADATRVYAALTIKGEEPRLAIVAFRRDTAPEQPLVLRPAWPLATHILAAERAEGSAENASVSAEIAASLALDGHGRLVCTTDLGLAACLDTRTGDLLWTHQDQPSQARTGSFNRRRARNPRGSQEPPPQPAEFLTTKTGARLGVLFAGARLLGLDMSDGSLSWKIEADGRGASGPRLPQQRATRLVKTNGIQAAYGGNTLFTFTDTGTRLQTVHLPFSCRGRGVVYGKSLVLPMRRGSSVQLYRYELAGVQGARAPLLGTVPNTNEPVNLTAIPGGIVAASRSRVLFLRWQ